MDGERQRPGRRADRGHIAVPGSSDSRRCGNGERLCVRLARSHPAASLAGCCARAGRRGAAESDGFSPPGEGRIVRRATAAAAMNCDRVAYVYRWLEYAVFGRALERRRTEFLGELLQASHILAL